jgi:hypothetical protein
MEHYDRKEIMETLLVKLPFHILGILVGMLAVFVAFQWVPQVLFAAINR